MKIFISICCITYIATIFSCKIENQNKACIPFCKIYDFNVKNQSYKLSLLRDTSGGFPTYAGTVFNAATLGGIYINQEEVDSARPEQLRFDFYSSGPQGFSFSGTVSPDGSAIDGFVKMQAQSTPADSVRCTMQAVAELPFSLFARTVVFPSISDSSTAPSTFSIKLVWPQVGIPAISAMHYKRDVEKLLEIKNSVHNYSVNECLKQYLQNAKENIYQENLNDVRGFVQQEEVETTLIYAGEKWITIAFRKSYHDQLMPHHQENTIYNMYDMRTGNHPKLGNFFTAEGIRKIPALLTKYFRIDYNLKLGEPLTKAGLYDNFIKPNNDYHVTGDALHFHYSNYEIAPYYAGEFDIAIPLTEFGTYFRYQPN